MRFLRYLLLALLAVALLTIALANRAPVALRLLPDSIGPFAGIGWTIQIPLFLVVFGGIVVGVLIGFVWEWLRETKHRSTASRKSREVASLEREVARLREDKPEHKDEVLALLESPRKAG